MRLQQMNKTEKVKGNEYESVSFLWLFPSFVEVQFCIRLKLWRRTEMQYDLENYILAIKERVIKDLHWKS